MAEKESRVKSAMGGEKKPSKKKSDGKKSKHKVHVMHVRHADNGGWIAQHDFEKPGMESMEPMPKSEDHIVPPGIENLQAHVGDHMSQEPEPEPQAAAGPPSSPAGPMAGM